MLKRSKRRKGSSSRSPQVPRDPQRSLAIPGDAQPHSIPLPPPLHSNSQPYTPAYEMGSVYQIQENQAHNPQMQASTMAQYYPQGGFNDAEHIWRGLEQTSVEQLPVWISDQSLGGQTFSQHGMEAFIIPTEYLPPTTQIW